MQKYLSKFSFKIKYTKEQLCIKDLLFIWIGGFIAVSIIALVAQKSDSLLILGSFGASCVLVFGYPKSPFSQPRNVIFGHFISTLIGLLCFHLLGDFWWNMAFALATAIVVMMLTDSVHPPAGSNPLIVFLLGSDWSFLFFPTLMGSIILVVVAVFYNNLHKNRAYPEYYL